MLNVTTTQRDALSANGDMIYNTTTKNSRI